MLASAPSVFPVALSLRELPVPLGTAHSIPRQRWGWRRQRGGCLAFMPRWFPALERSRAGSCTLPQLPSPSLGLSAFVPLPGTWPSGVWPEPKERWPRARSAPRSKPGTGALQRRRGHPESRGSVLLHSAGSAMSRSVPSRARCRAARRARCSGTGAAPHVSCFRF